MATREDVVKLICDAVKQAQGDADVAGVVQEGDRIYGQFVSSIFADMPIESRTEWIEHNVREKLGFEGSNVGVLIPLSPDEVEEAA
jgi:hypothetical protein